MTPDESVGGNPGLLLLLLLLLQWYDTPLTD